VQLVQLGQAHVNIGLAAAHLCAVCVGGAAVAGRLCWWRTHTTAAGLKEPSQASAQGCPTPNHSPDCSCCTAAESAWQSSCSCARRFCSACCSDTSESAVACSACSCCVSCAISAREPHRGQAAGMVVGSALVAAKHPTEQQPAARHAPTQLTLPHLRRLLLSALVALCECRQLPLVARGHSRRQGELVSLRRDGTTHLGTTTPHLRWRASWSCASPCTPARATACWRSTAQTCPGCA
jgi:hypothetical protein